LKRKNYKRTIFSFQSMPDFQFCKKIIIISQPFLADILTFYGRYYNELGT